MPKLPTNKTLLIILVVALIALVIFFGVTLYSAAQTAERETEVLTANTITASDIAPYLTGIVDITCNNTDGIFGGSGSLWNLPNLGYTVLTNEHVLEDDNNTTTNNLGVSSGGFTAYQKATTIKNACSFSLNGDGSDNYYIPLANKYRWNKEADAADLPIYFNSGIQPPASFTTSSSSVSDLNYSISDVRLCPTTIPVGSPVALIGFPSYAEATTTVNGVSSTQNYEITTTGIISGYTMHDVITGAALHYPDFFTSAITDAGNSGGIAFSKDSNGLCVLGIPTFIVQGEYTSEGVGQNIKNVFLKD